MTGLFYINPSDYLHWLKRMVTPLVPPYTPVFFSSVFVPSLGLVLDPMTTASHCMFMLSNDLAEVFIFLAFMVSVSSGFLLKDCME